MPPTPPTASATSGRRRIFGSSDSAKGGAVVVLFSLLRSNADLPGHRRVGAAVDRGEDPAERPLDRVGEDVGAGDERDAEDDRDRSQRRAQLAPRHAPQRDVDHALSEFITASTSAGSACLPSWRTICPSARKRMRSAIAAARASCVTITVV